MHRNTVSVSGISRIGRKGVHSDGNRSFSVFVLLALTNWISHFFYFRDFGLYEDDYAFIADAMARDASYLLEKLQYFVLFPQGRPVGFYCAAVLPFIGDKLGGLGVDYLLAFAITTLNSYLFYRLLKFTELEVIAVTGGLIFCLFPADTTKIFLTHAFILQISLTFLLLASLCYLENRKALSYVVILGSLLSYESAFMVFFGLPLLNSKWDRAWVKQVVRHAAILIAFMAGVALIRLMGHESRVSSLVAQPDQGLLLLLKVFGAITIGTNESLSLLITAPFAAIAHWNLMTVMAAGLCLGLFLLKFLRLETPPPDNSIHIPNRLLNFSRFKSIAHQTIPASYLKILQLLLVGLGLLGLSYALAFTAPHYPPTTDKGRLTSVHLAATVGGSLVAACLLSLMLMMAAANHRKRVTAVLLSLYLACLVGYQFTIQIDFKQSWYNQRRFWTDVLANSPDIDEKTTVLVVDRNLPQTDFILTHSWADPLVLKQIFRLPTLRLGAFDRSPVLSDQSWAQPPVLFLVPDDWQHQITTHGRSWTIPLTTWQGYSIDVVPETTIVLEQHGEHLVRINSPITINGQPFNFKPIPNQQSVMLQRGPLFKYLIDPDLPLHED